MEINNAFNNYLVIQNFPHASLKNESKQVKFLNPSNSQYLDVAVNRIRQVKNESLLKPPSEKNGFVSFTVSDENGKLYRIKVKVEDYAKIKMNLNTDLDAIRGATLSGSSSKLETKNPQVIASGYGVTKKEFNAIQNFYERSKPLLEKMEQPTFISRHKGLDNAFSDLILDEKLPRSLVYVPTEPGKGLYILFKTHGNIRELGIGAFNRATEAMHYETGESKVLRNGKRSNVNENEINANALVLNQPEHFAAGIPFEYVGDYRSRQGTKEEARISGLSKNFIPKEKNVRKLGFIMNKIAGGDLETSLATRMMSLPNKVVLAKECVHHLAILHHTYELIHRDLKPANILINEKGSPLIADFGFTVKKGDLVKINGNREHLAPEVLQAFLKRENRPASFEEDVWSTGVVLLEIFGGGHLWREFISHRPLNGPTKIVEIVADNLSSVDSLEYEKSRIFSALLEDTSDGILKDELNAILSVIDACLQWDPTDRITLKEAAARLENIHLTFCERASQETSSGGDASDDFEKSPSFTKEPFTSAKGVHSKGYDALENALGGSEPLVNPFKRSESYDASDNKLMRSDNDYDPPN